ncbi:hypothetical protein Glove_328g99 [Diversispora epigaea]|uniref:CCHC-type domain-containing protein n=1 Tax=Diversispora epigaea TaxID=1348612 RepID=A0A397HP19_9GLOM|nr:hypothetical protein Glove_328g99 [Diversispora epigaea]
MDNLVATIKKLRIQIQKNEDYITYLKKEITTRDDEIDILRIQVNDLKIRLRKAEAGAQSNDKNISALELQLEEMGKDISLLQHRLQKIRGEMSLTTSSTLTNVFTLIDETKINIRVLFNSIRGENNLLNDEIDNLQTQIELKLTQIQNKCRIYKRENNQLREGLAPDYEMEVGRLQTTINEQRDRIDELANHLQDRYDTVLDERDRYRTECFQHEETLRGVHENFEDESQAYLDLQDEYTELKENLRIAGLQIIVLRVRRLILTNRGYALWQEANNRARHYKREYRLREQQLQQCQADKELLEYNRDQLFNRYYNKFKDRKASMVGYELKKFNGHPTEDPEEHVEEFRLWLVGSGIDVGAGHANRVNAHGVFAASLKGAAKDWYKRTIYRKNWKLRNLPDNTAQANLGAVQGRTAAQLGAQALNWANGQAGTVVIPAHTVFDEDWSFADGRPTDRLPNAPNANTGNAVIVPDIRLEQVLYWFKTNYPTVTAEKQRVLFGLTVQGSDPVGRFYSNLCRLARLAVHRLRIEKTLDELLPKLEEIERYTAEQLSGAYLHSNSDSISPSKSREKNNYSNDTGMTDEIKNYVKSMMTSTQPSSSLQQFFQPDLRAITKTVQDAIARAAKTLENKKPPYKQNPGNAKKVEDIFIKQFLDEINKQHPTIDPAELYDYDPVDNITDSMAGLSLNKVIAGTIRIAGTVRKTVHAVLKTSQYTCSECGKTGHNSRNCPKNKRKRKSSRPSKNKSHRSNKKRGSINIATKDSGSDSDSNTSSSDNESNSDSGSSSSSESESDSENNFTEDDVVKIINAVNVAKSKKK